MPLPYGQVKDLYDQLHGSGAVTQSLPEWSQQMGDLTGTDAYSEGLHDNWVRSTSHSVDKLLDATGLPDLGASFGRSVGGAFGYGDVGEAAGRSLPRMALETAPLAIPVVGPAISGGLMGLHTYADTGSVAAGVTSGLVGAALPFVANKASQSVLGALGARYAGEPLTYFGNRLATAAETEAGVGTTAKILNQYLPQSVSYGSRLLAEGAGHVAGALTMGAGDIAREALDPNEHVTNPFTPEFAVQLGLQTLPFSVLHAGMGLLHDSPVYDKAALDSNIESTRVALEKQATQRQAEQAPPITQKPNYDPTAFSVEDQEKLREAQDRVQQITGRGDRIAELRQQISAAPADADPDDLAAKHDELQALQQEQFDATKGVGVLDGQPLDPHEDVTHVPMVGTDYVKSNNGRSATFTVADHPLNTDSGYEAGDRVNYSTVYEHAGPPVDNGDGTTTVQVPVGWHQQVTDEKGRLPEQVVKQQSELTPDLPAQQEPLTQERQEASSKLIQAQQVLNDAMVAKDPQKFHDAKVIFNQAREAAGFAPVDDATLAQWQQMTKAEADEATAGRINETQTVLQKQKLVEIARAQELEAIKARVTALKIEGAGHTDEFSDLDTFLADRQATFKDGNRPDLFWKVVEKWYGDGQKGGTDRLDNMLEEQAGKRVKEKAPDEVIKASREKILATQHVRTILLAHARVIFDEYRPSLDDEQLEDAKAWLATIESGDTLDPKISRKDHIVDLNDSLLDSVGAVSGREDATGTPVRAPRPMQAPTPAGKGWVWGLGDYDEQRDALNGQPLKGLGAKDGVLPEARFLQLAGRGKPLNATELAVGKVLVPEAFKDGGVDVRKLYAGLKGRGPVVETKELTLDSTGKIVTAQDTYEEQNRIRHELDTKLPDWFDYLGDTERQNKENLSQDVKDKLARFDELINQDGQIQDQGDEEGRLDQGKAQYSFLGPKAESDMPGYVEGLVRLPTKNMSDITDKEGYVVDAEGRRGQHDVNSLRGLKYSGPHFGSEDKNVLAFYRGYEETLPDGTKAFHVIETQSDWGQKLRKEQADIAKAKEAGTFNDKTNWKGVLTEDHPLLKDDVWKTLALKAAIQHAREIGATKIILSDGETAMMTEGHDKAAPHLEVERKPTKNEAFLRAGDLTKETGEQHKPSFDPNEDGSYSVLNTERKGDPTQSAGMRLHYDSALPSAMRKLTGDRGERVELGVHKGAQEQNESDDVFERLAQNQEDRTAGRITVEEFQRRRDAINNEQVTKGSPVFRNPDGTPKSSITGTVYDLGEAFRRQDEQAGANTLGDPTRAPSRIVPYKPQTPDEAAMIERLGLSKTGTEVLQAQVGHPTLGGLARDLLTRFPEALKRIVAQVTDSSDPSFAQRARNNLMGIFYSRGLLGMDDTSRNFEIVHEIVHGLTEHALVDEKNAPIVQGLSDLRQRLIQALPGEQRAVFDELVKSNWYDKYAQDANSVPPLYSFGDGPTTMRLYGLLSNSELLAQGFSSSDMRQFMESVKGQQGIGGWSQFKNFVKSILGLGEKVKGTAFDEFMNYSSRLMSAGEHLSEAHNFLDEYFRNQGAGEEEAQRQTTRALGVLQSTGWDATKDGIFDTLQQQQPIPTQELLRSSGVLYKMLAAKGDDFQSASKVVAETGFPMTKTGIDDMVDHHLRSGESLDNALMLLPDSVADYIYAKVGDMQNVMDAVQGATAKVNDGLLNVSHPEDIRDSVSEVQSALTKVLEAKEDHDEAISTLQQLLAVSPKGFTSQQRVMAPPNGGEKMNTVADFVEPKSKSAWKSFVNWTQQMGQLAKTNPETAELINAGFWMKPQTRWMANQMMRPFALDPKNPEGGFSQDAKARVSQVFRDKKVLAAVNNWIYQNQKVGGDSVVRLDAAHPDVAAKLQGLTPEQKTLAENAVIMHGAMKTIASNFILNHMADIASWDGTSILSENGKKVSDNFQLTSGLFRNLAMTDWNDPQKAATAQAQIQAIQSNMTPDQFNDLTKFMQAEVGKWQAHKDFFAQNSDWATAKRYGKFLVEYMDGGKRVTAGVDSKKEADVLTRGKQVLGFKSNVKEGIDDDFIPSIAMNAGLRQRIADAQSVSDSILQDKLSPEAFEQYQKYNPATQLLTEATGSGIPDNQVGYGRTRQLTKGADQLPWLENQFKWVQNTASYWNRATFRAKASGMLSDPEIASNPDVRSRLAMHVDNMLTPDPENAQLMTKFVSTWALGFRPSTAIVTASHSIIRHTAELTRLTGKPIDSFLRMKRAMGEIIGTITGGQQNPEHQWLMKEADKFGERENGWFDDENSNQEKVVLNFLDDVKGEKPRTLGSQLSAAGGTYSRVGMWMFQQARRVNEEAALYASYDYYREQGLNQVQARDKAFEFNHAVNTVGGTAQRPAGLFQSGVPRTAAMAAYSLRSYVVGTIGQLGRYIMEGSPWAHEDLTPAEKWNARKAALQMVAMQATAAGLLGLPAVGSGIAILNQLFPNLQLPQKTREGVSELLGGDHWSTDVAMGGLPSMLGWDLKSRLSMGNVVPGVSDSDGFQPSNLLGAPLNLATNWITGAKNLASGDPAGLLNLMPSGVKDVLKLAGADGPQNDAKGRQLFQPTPGEAVGAALGFRPTRLSDAQQQERLSQQTSKVLNEQEGRWRQARAQDVVQGNFGSVRQALLDRSRQDPSYDVSSAGKDIASASEAMSFPYDPTRSGNLATSAEQQRLLSTFSMPQAPANEVARAQFRVGVLQRLGLNPGDVGSQLRQAALEDQIKASSPTLTRSQIQLAAKRRQASQRAVPLLAGQQ